MTTTYQAVLPRRLFYKAAKTFALALLLPSLAAAPATHAQGQQVQQVQNVRFLPVPARTLLYDASSGKIFATVGSNGSGGTANSVVVIDPKSGQIGPSTFVGDDPSPLTLSEGGKYLYVAVNGGTAVRRLDLPALTAGPLYPMTGKPVRALLPLPGQSEGFVALRGNHARYDDTLGMFVDGKLVGNEAGCAPQVAPGIVPSRLFTYQNMLSSWDFDGYDVADGGIAHVVVKKPLLTGNIHLTGTANGLIFTSRDNVIDPEMRRSIGNLNFNGESGAHLPDPGSGYVFQIGEIKKSKGQSIASCDLRTFQYTGSLRIPSGVEGGGGSPVRWGADGIAYTAGNGVVLCRIPLPRQLPTTDLSVVRSEIPKTLPQDHRLTYTLTVTNNSRSAASGVSLTDALPESVDVLSVKASQGNATSDDGVVRAELGTLAPGATTTVDVALQFQEVKQPRFVAVVRAFEPDPARANNIARFVPTEPLSPLADLTGSWTSLRQASEGAGINLHSTLLGQFVVRNEGKQASRPATLRFYFSLGPRFDVQGCPLIQEVSIPSLRPGRSFTANLQAPLEEDDLTGFYVFAVLDADRTLRESNRDNNVIGNRIP